MGRENNMEKARRLEDKIANAFRDGGFWVFVRKNRIDVLAFTPDCSLGYVIECKNYELSRKQQQNAVQQLNREEYYARDICEYLGINVKYLLKILCAQSFHHGSFRYGIYQYTPSDLIEHALR